MSVSPADQAEITVNSRNYDGSVRRTWTCELVKRDDQLLVLVGIFDRDVTHADLGFIRKGTISYEYYWLDRWYNVFRFHEPDGSFRNFYCNVNIPPTFGDGVLDYVDLDIDVVVWPTGEMVVLDRDEFAINAEKFKFPPELVAQAEAATNELIRMIEGSDALFEPVELGLAGPG